MDYKNKRAKTLEDVLDVVQRSDLPPFHHRDITSAIKRICELASVAPTTVPAEAPTLRAMIAKVRPAAHGVTSKTWANLLSRFRAALRLADVIDSAWQGAANQNPTWAPLVGAIAKDKRLSFGLACFFNWCATQGIAPTAVDDAVSSDSIAGSRTGRFAPSRAASCDAFQTFGTKRAKGPASGRTSSSPPSPSSRLQSGSSGKI